MAKVIVSLGGSIRIGDVPVYQVPSATYAFFATGDVGDVGTVRGRLREGTPWVDVVSLTVQANGMAYLTEVSMQWVELEITDGTGANEAKIEIVRAV